MCLLVGGEVALCLAGSPHQEVPCLPFADNLLFCILVQPHQSKFRACNSSAIVWSNSDPRFRFGQACPLEQQNMHELVPFCHALSAPASFCCYGALGPFTGCRVGEAKNPGPNLPRGQQDIRHFLGQTPQQPEFRQPHAATERHLFTLGVANPTSVLHKDPEISQLGADLLFLSETSAVARTQHIMRARLRQTGFSVVWGHPVQSHDSAASQEQSLRGHAAGVAIVSSGQAHLPVPQMPTKMLATQRLVEAMIRFGPIEIRSIAVYGFPRNRSGYLEQNQLLLNMALQRVQVSGVPTVIGGDFNRDITELPAWDSLRALGYVEAFQFAADRLAKILPATCRNSTKHDTVLLPPFLQPLLQRADVLVDAHLFDSHAPMLLTFAMPYAYPALLHWKLPRTWADLQPEPQEVAKAYSTHQPLVLQQIGDCANPADLQTALQQWAQTVEWSVDAAISLAHKKDPSKHPVPRLPKSARGRCQGPTTRWQRLPQAARSGRRGDYAPPDEAVSIQARMMVRQVRRLQTSCRGRDKLERTADTTLAAQLQQEWLAIIRGKGFPPNFPQWILRVAHFHAFWKSNPPLEWVKEVYDYTRFATDARIRQAAQHCQKLAQFKLQWNTKHTGMSQGFAAIKPVPNLPFSTLPVVERRDVLLTQVIDPEHVWAEVQQPQFLRHFMPCQTSQGQLRIVDQRHVDSGAFEVLLQHDGLQLVPAQTLFLEQHTCASSPEELHREFYEYWSKIWNRDRGKKRTCEEEWADALHDLPPLPECAVPLQISDFDIEAWKTALRGMRPSKATGCCGFTVRELKHLPNPILQDLSKIFEKGTTLGLPKSLAAARVAILSKRLTPTCMSHG